MQDWVIALIVVVVVLAIVVAAGLFMRRKQASKQLRERYGSEYDRLEERTGDSQQAEEELRAREERRDRFELRDLDDDEQERYQAYWQALQRRFVDEPDTAVRDADQLVTDLMADRGYPMDDFEQRAEDLSVDHPQVVDNYRRAADIAAANARGQAETEELRRAMRHFRALFDELLGATPSDTKPRETR